MSGISVIDADGEIQEFAEATTWHIDERGQLHLKSDSGPVASFAKDRWQGAGTSTADSPALNAQAAATQAYTAELAEVHAVIRDVLAEVRAIPKQLAASVTKAVAK